MLLYDVQRLLPKVLANVPEIQAAYEAERAATARSIARWTEQDFKDMEEIRWLHNLPPRDERELGVLLVINDIVVPFVIQLARTGKQHRLQEIFTWVEELAQSNEAEVRNLIRMAFCEPLITTYSKDFLLVAPYVGEHTKTLCRDLYPWFKVPHDVQQLLTPDAKRS